MFNIGCLGADISFLKLFNIVLRTFITALMLGFFIPLLSLD